MTRAPGASARAIEAFLSEHFSQGQPAQVEYADGERAVVRLAFDPSQIRPGGTISGPTMMSLADTAMYALIFSAIGIVPLAVTTNLSINFLRKPGPGDIAAQARMLKLGKALAVGEVDIRSVGAHSPAAHAVVTYSIPPDARP
jgi:uncharacterized protein (TIGR00369 family)